MNDISEHQLDALPGSKALHVEVFFQGQFTPSPKALANGTRRLLEALKDSEVGGPAGKQKRGAIAGAPSWPGDRALDQVLDAAREAVVLWCTGFVAMHEENGKA